MDKNVEPAPLRRAVAALLLSVLMVSLSLGQSQAFDAAGEPISPPPAPPSVAQDRAPDPHRTDSSSTTNLSVDPTSRSESQSFYNAVYMASENTPMEWTGDHALCNMGQTSQPFRAGILRRVNYFRAMAGVPADVELTTDYNFDSQAAALMMSANNDLDHNPPTEWACYSEHGHNAAQHANLYLTYGTHKPIRRYMRDASSTTVGHRRWILFPQTQQMGTGDVPATDGRPGANALWVIDENTFAPRPPTRHAYTAWPPPGFVPYPVVFARWSFFHPGADFASATVTMTRNGQPISAPIDARIDNGTSGESGMVWRPRDLSGEADWPRPDADTPYIVTIENVRIDGAPRTFTYTVTIFDPAVDGDTETDPHITLSESVGAPGSEFVLTGSHFEPDEPLEIRVNDLYLATVTADENGAFVVHFNTEDVAGGVFEITVTSSQRSGAPAGSLYFTLEESAPTHDAPDSDGSTEPVEVTISDPLNPSEAVLDQFIYLPAIQR